MMGQRLSSTDTSDMSGVRGDCDGLGGQRMESEWREITLDRSSVFWAAF